MIIFRNLSTEPATRTLYERYIVLLYLLKIKSYIHFLKKIKMAGKTKWFETLSTLQKKNENEKLLLFYILIVSYTHLYYAMHIDKIKLSISLFIYLSIYLSVSFAHILSFDHSYSRR